MSANILKIGHRGAMGYCKENTIASFEKAIELGVDMIELDVHLKNDKLFVAHKIKKLADGCPTLEKVIDSVGRRVKINVELKGKGTAGPVALVIKDYLGKGWSSNDFMVSSFRAEELEDFKKINLGVKLGFLVKNRRTRIIKKAGKLSVYSVNLSLKLAKKGLINKLHKQGFKVFVWTANKKKDINRLMSLGADGIFSDYPDRL